jgi:hypothetical protein
MRLCGNPVNIGSYFTGATEIEYCQKQDTEGDAGDCGSFWRFQIRPSHGSSVRADSRKKRQYLSHGGTSSVDCPCSGVNTRQYLIAY